MNVTPLIVSVDRSFCRFAEKWRFIPPVTQKRKKTLPDFIPHNFLDVYVGLDCSTIVKYQAGFDQ